MDIEEQLKDLNKVITISLEENNLLDLIDHKNKYRYKGLTKADILFRIAKILMDL